MVPTITVDLPDWINLAIRPSCTETPTAVVGTEIATKLLAADPQEQYVHVEPIEASQGTAWTVYRIDDWRNDVGPRKLRGQQMHAKYLADQARREATIGNISAKLATLGFSAAQAETMAMMIVDDKQSAIAEQLGINL